MASVDDVYWADRNERILLDLPTLQALNLFLKRPWFNRLWIIQEVYFASRSSLLLCGITSIEWQQARVAISAISSKSIYRPSDTKPGWDTYRWRELKPSLRQSTNRLATLCRRSVIEHGPHESYHFLDLCTRVRDAECSDPRDKVFALLSLVSLNQLPNKPDYTETPAGTFRKTVMSLLQEHPHLEFLRLCDFWNRNSEGPS